MQPSAPRYPEATVQIHSDNPFALVSATRMALRRLHVDRNEIMRFTDLALASDDPERARDVCTRWVQVTPWTEAKPG